jgi:SAM-dependent methyltransferase
MEFENRVAMLDFIPKGGTVAELGVFAGDFAAEIIARCQPKKLALVDLWPDNCFSEDENGGNPRLFQSGDDLYKSVVGRLRKDSFGFYYNTDFLSVYRFSTNGWFSQQYSGVFDFIYIDADHSYPAVKADLKEAWRCLRRGGYLAGHDYSVNPAKVVNAEYYNHMGVKTAVDEFMADKGIQMHGLAMDGYTSFLLRKP